MTARPGEKDQAKYRRFRECQGLNRVLVDDISGR